MFIYQALELFLSASTNLSSQALSSQTQTANLIYHISLLIYLSSSLSISYIAHNNFEIQNSSLYRLATPHDHSLQLVIQNRTLSVNIIIAIYHICVR